MKVSEGSTNLAVYGISRPAIEVAPETQLRKHPPKRTTKRRAKFTFGSNGLGASFECKLDKKPFRSCTSPFIKRKVKIGSHTFKVRAVAIGGLPDPSPVEFRWRVIR